MKVLLHADVVGGVFNCTVGLAGALLRRGVRVVLAAPSSWDRYRRFPIESSPEENLAFVGNRGDAERRHRVDELLQLHASLGGSA